MLLDDAPVGVDVGVLAMDATGRLGPLALLGHLRLEPGEVDGDAALGGDLLGQFEREAVRVVEGEGRRTGQHAAGGTSVVAELALEDRQAVAQRVAEVLLLLAEHADDEVALAGDVGIGVAHHVDGDLGELGEDDLVGAEEVGVAHGAADDPAQHVAARLVGREHPVGDEHRGGAGVLGEDADGEAVAVVVVAGLVGACRSARWPCR